jgi:ectoine hydroxylase-related dioxygenase (phytanoyl-CoA dioxygenase family)
MGVTTVRRRAQGAARTAGPLTADQRALYRTQGYLVVEQSVPEELLGWAEGLADARMEARIATWRREGVPVDDDAEDLRLRFHRGWVAAGCPRMVSTVDDELRRHLMAAAGEPWLAALTASVLGCDDVQGLATCFLRTKVAGDDGTTLAWHQDLQCLHAISGPDFVTAWIPLDDVAPRTSCLEVAPVGPGQAMFTPAMSEVTEYTCMRPEDTTDLAPTRVIAMRRGDLLLMSPLLPHRTVDGIGPHVRCSVDLRVAPARPSPP